jgi:hypothetical protein
MTTTSPNPDGTTFSTSAGTSDFLDPVFAFDGNDATFYKSAVPPRKHDHFTLTFPQARQMHAIEILTGVSDDAYRRGCQFRRTRSH